MTARIVMSTLPLLALGLVGPRQAPPPISRVHYELRFDAATARQRSLDVTMTFDVAAALPIRLSLPAWTPGAYEISNFARNVRSFEARQEATVLRWDKADFDTWRVRPVRAGPVTLRFTYFADELDNARAWARTDFLLVNGTNVFLYPEGMNRNFPATVTVKTQAGWTVITGMHRGSAGSYRETNYHDLVDMPFFIGRLEVDSSEIGGKWYRLASWPAGVFRGVERQQFHRELAGSVPAMTQVFGETPWDSYTTLLLFEPTFSGGSALEHQNSHVGIYQPEFIGTPILASITAHEIFHGWNVKRLRPADLWPYRYDQPQQTVWLWVSEGITDYYADLALVRGGVVDSAGFLALTQEKIDQVYDAPAVSLEDASLSTWISPTDGTSSIYYPKGALAGLLLDLIIRDASDNRQSLDHVMRDLYQRAWKAGRGFTAEDWWSAVRQAAGGRSFEHFAERYIDGRDEFPWSEVLPLAGFRLSQDSVREPRIGISTSADSSSGAVIVTQVVPAGMGAEAGLEPGDRLISVGDITVAGADFGVQFRRRYAAEPEGVVVPIVVERAGRRQSLQGRLRQAVRVVRQFQFDPAPSAKAARIRKSLLGG
ncbi:MAG TPA: PDZ domain-containing protein [Gemmatimonadales bacterium]